MDYWLLIALDKLGHEDRKIKHTHCSEMSTALQGLWLTERDFCSDVM